MKGVRTETDSFTFCTPDRPSYYEYSFFFLTIQIREVEINKGKIGIL